VFFSEHSVEENSIVMRARPTLAC